MPTVWIEDPEVRPKAIIRNVADGQEAKLTLPLPLRREPSPE